MKGRPVDQKIYLTNLSGTLFHISEVEWPSRADGRLEFLRKLIRESGNTVFVRYYGDRRPRPMEYLTNVLLEARITRENEDGSYDLGWKRDYWIKND